MARRTRSVRGRRSRRGGDPPTRAERVKALKTGPPLPSSGAPDWTFGKAFVPPKLLTQAEEAEWRVKSTDRKKQGALDSAYDVARADGRVPEANRYKVAYNSPAYTAADNAYEAAFKKSQGLDKKINDIRTGASGLQSTLASRAAVGTPGGRRTRRRGRKARSTRRRRA